MGYMTPVLILNDHFNRMERDPAGMVAEISRLMNYGGATWGNGLQVLPTQHADTPRVLFAHRNDMIELSAYSKETRALAKTHPDHVRAAIRDAEWQIEHLKKLLDESREDG